MHSQDSQEVIGQGREARLRHLLISQTIISATFARQEPARLPIIIWIKLNLASRVQLCVNYFNNYASFASLDSKYIDFSNLDKLKSWLNKN